MASTPEMDLSSFQQEVTSSTGSFSTSYDDFYDQVRTNYHFGCNYFCNITLVRSSYHWALAKMFSLSSTGCLVSIQEAVRMGMKANQKGSGFRGKWKYQYLHQQSSHTPAPI